MLIPEILAPAGSFQSLIAAVEAGADAIYLGGKRFSARASAANLDDDELKEGIDYAHLRGVKIYVTINTLYKDKEFKELVDFVAFLYSIGVDALILQDLGAAKVIRQHFHNIELHGSTQMTIHNIEGAKVLEELGFDRVVLARELSLKEISRIKKAVNIGLETFVHGALCFCYSGQCLMSSMIGGRSGNRGRCAQPCRRFYQMESDGILKEQGYLLSPKDLCSIDIVKELAELGISSLKIEGRMKRPEYVGIVVLSYRKLFDGLKNGIEIDKHGIEKELLQIFNRGFTKGYYTGYPKDLISYDSPKNKGLYLGKVTNTYKDSIVISLHEELSLGDGIEVNGSGANVSKIFKLKEANAQRSANTGNKSDNELRTPVDKGIRGDKVIIPGKVAAKIGDRVYKTSDVELLRTGQEFYSGKIMKRVPVTLSFKGKIDEAPVVKLKDPDGNEITIEGVEPCQRSNKIIMSLEDIKEKLFQIGDIPFEITDFDIDIDDNLFIPVRTIKEIRRDAFEKLTELRKNKSKRAYLQLEINKLNNDFKGLKVKNSSIKIAVKLPRLSKLKEFLKGKPDEIIIDISSFKDFDSANAINSLDSANKDGVEITLALPTISHPDKMDQLKDIISNLQSLGYMRYLISNIGCFKLFDNLDVSLHGDYNLNIFNKYSIEYFKGLGLDSFTPSLELSFREIEEMMEPNLLPMDLVVHGNIPIMTTAYRFDIEADENYTLSDEKNIKFPLKKYETGSIIYNSVPLSMLKDMDRIASLSPRSIRIENNFSSIPDIELIRLYRSALSKEFIGDDQFKSYTKGHYFRGVD
jgi:putative protease